MSESYGRLQSLVYPPGSRVTQHSNMSQFNTGGRGRCGRRRGRGYGGIGIAVAVVVGMVDEDDIMEGAMFINHMNSPAGTEYLWQKFVHTLHTNG